MLNNIPECVCRSEELFQGFLSEQTSIANFDALFFHSKYTKCDRNPPVRVDMSVPSNSFRYFPSVSILPHADEASVETSPDSGNSTLNDSTIFDLELTTSSSEVQSFSWKFMFSDLHLNVFQKLFILMDLLLFIRRFSCLYVRINRTMRSKSMAKTKSSIGLQTTANHITDNKRRTSKEEVLFQTLLPSKPTTRFPAAQSNCSTISNADDLLYMSNYCETPSTTVDIKRNSLLPHYSAMPESSALSESSSFPELSQPRIFPNSDTNCCYIECLCCDDAIPKFLVAIVSIVTMYAVVKTTNYAADERVFESANSFRYLLDTWKQNVPSLDADLNASANHIDENLLSLYEDSVVYEMKQLKTFILESESGI